MKIGIMGAHGTGKTTLAHRVATNKPGNVVVVEETARSCPYPVNEKMTLDSQRWIFARQISAEHQFHGYAGTVVCDRTVIDPVIYAMWADQAADTPMPDLAAWINVTLPFALDWMRSYDRLYWCRFTGRAMVDDGFRSTDADFADQVDALFEHVVNTFGLNPVEIAPPTFGFERRDDH